MAEERVTELFQGLITDIGISKARDTQTVQGWYITPYQFRLSETKGEFTTTRTTMNTTWYSGEFSAIDKMGTNRIQLTLSLDGDEDTIQRDIQEIYIVCKTPDGEEFLYAIVQPLMPIKFTPTVAQEMNFLLALTNTQGQDIYKIEYIDETKLNAYQLVTEKGNPNGYCPLGADGIVTDNYLPNRDNLPIGSIVPILCSANYIPKGYVPCDGSEFTYAQFKEVYEDYLLAGLLPTCTYTEYINSINTFGSCGKFGLDTTQGKFKVPYIKNGTTLQQALTNSEIAKLYNAGLPNINGDIRVVNEYNFDNSSVNDVIKGAFAVKTFPATAGATINQNTTPTNDGIWSVTFDASRSNAIYGKSNTVQPNAVSIRWFVILNHGLVTDSRFTDEDWQAWITQLNKNTTDINKNTTDINKNTTDINKNTTDINDLKNRVYLKASYRSGHNGYVIYSNGFCIQWGQTASLKLNATATIKLLKKFADTNYTMSGSTPYVQTAGDKGSTWAITSLKQDSFTWRSSFEQTSSYIRWQAIGFLAAGEY